MATNKGVGFSPKELIPLLHPHKCYTMAVLLHFPRNYKYEWTTGIVNVFVRDSLPHELHGAGVWLNNRNRGELSFRETLLSLAPTPAFIEYHYPPAEGVTAMDTYNRPEEFNKYKGNFKYLAGINNGVQEILPNGYIYQEYVNDVYHRTGTGEFIKEHLERWIPQGHFADVSIYLIPCNSFDLIKPTRLTPLELLPKYIYLGTAAPPPPPHRDMSCCDCNSIATIVAEQAIADIKQHQATRDLVAYRMLEGLREINKMLQGMQIDLNLQPVIDRLNELEANLWNGLNAGN